MKTQSSSRNLSTLYGAVNIHEQVLIDLLQAPTMLRLQEINQYGITPFIQKIPPYSRYTHSVGVMALLRLYGAPLEEQIAGLLHDVSHTVFSHVGDFLYASSHNDSYQDTIHQWFIEQTELKEILTTHGYQVSDIIHKNGMFKLLEQDIPEICADRLEYVLYGGQLKNIFTTSDIQQLLGSLKTIDSQWYFDNKEKAKLFGNCSLKLTTNEFASASGLLTYKWAAQALQRACDINLITKHDIHFSIDDIVWKKLCECNDKHIKHHVHNLLNYKKIIALSDEHDHDIHMTGKFRGINPLVKHNNTLQRLTDIDPDYKKEFEEAQRTVNRGCFIKLCKM